MADLQEKQFELDGVVFGLYADIGLIDWDPGNATTRTSDQDNPTGDGRRMGRDFKTPGTWNFSLYVDGEDEDDGWRILANLAEAWDGDWVREEPDRVVPLRYRVAGQERVVFGRPRAWSAIVNNTSVQGRIDVECQFVLVDHRFYDAEQRGFRIPVAVPLELDAGLEVPFIAPFVTSAGASVRESSIEVGGDMPTPITLTFDGPIAEAAVRIGGWTAALVDPVPADNPVVIDGRPWVRSATYLSDGGGVRVSPRVTRISKMLLPPGHHEIVFTGDDPTSQASVLVSWRNAYRTPR